VEAQRGQPGSVLEAYRHAIALRAAHPALARGDARAVAGLPATLLGVWRTLEGAEPVLVLANLANREAIVAGLRPGAPHGASLRPIDGRAFDGDGDGTWVLPAHALRLLTPAR
jgi:hypothetical protein